VLAGAALLIVLTAAGAGAAPNLRSSSGIGPTASLRGGVLVVTDSPGTASRILVRAEVGGRVQVASASGPNAAFRQVGGATGVRGVVVRAGAGDDAIRVVGLRLTRGLVVRGGEGADRLSVRDVVSTGSAGAGLTGRNLASAVVRGGRFNGNGGAGIDLRDAGDIRLTGVVAQRNTTGVIFATSTSCNDTAGNFSANANHGIAAVDCASMTLTRTVADDNDADNNNVGDGVNVVDGGDAGTLAVTGDLVVRGVRFRDTDGTIGADFHQERGLFASVVGGAVTFDNSTGVIQSNIVTGNEQDGVTIVDGGTTATFAHGTFSDNGLLAGHDGIDVAGLSSLLTLNGPTVNGNRTDGVRAHIVGGVTWTNGSATGNGNTGAEIDNVATNVNVSGASLSNNAVFFSGGDGLAVNFASGVVLDSATATGNDAGLFLMNITSLADTDGTYSSNKNHGIKLVDVSGSVTLTRTTAQNNDANGDSTGDGVNATDGADGNLVAIGDNLNVTGGSFIRVAPGSQRHGIFVVGNGAGNGIEDDASFTASGPTSVTVTGNSADGVSIDGADAASFSGGAYSSNGDDGIDLNASGDITLNGITASSNNSDGVEAGFSTTMFAMGSTFSNNGSEGLDAFHFSSTTLSDLTLSGNVSVSGGVRSTDTPNLAYTTSVGVTSDIVAVTGTQIHRTSPAQQLISYSDVVNLLVATGAGDDTVTASGITLAGQLSLDGGIGTDVVTLSSTNIAGGSADGLRGSSLEAVAISSSSFTDNADDGIELLSSGAVALAGVTATGNAGTGVVVNGAISFSDTDGTYATNFDHGIALTDVAGDVTLTRTVADDNDANVGGTGDGVNAADGADAGTDAIGGNLLVRGARFRDTATTGVQRRGLFVNAIAGAATFQDSTGVVQSNVVTGNLLSGVAVANGGTTATFENGTYSSNGQHGIGLASLSGAATVTGVTAQDNLQDGVNLNGASNVFFTGGAFTGNTQEGVDASNVTSLSISGVSLSGNGTVGAKVQTAIALNYTTSSTPSADTVVVTSTQFQRSVPFQQEITYAGVTNLNLAAGAGQDIFTMKSEGASSEATLDGGAGADEFQFDNTAAASVGQVAIAEAGGCVDGDALNFALLSPGVTLNLGVTTAQAVNANLQLRMITADGIQDVLGTPVGDTITGNGCDNEIFGSGGTDELTGGSGDDTITAGGSPDTATGSAGDDLFVWNAGDGNDVVNGDADVDTLQFNGANGPEIMGVGPNGGRVTLTRNVGAIVMDIGTTEAIEVNALDGDDSLSVVPLAATSVTYDGGPPAASDSLSFDGGCTAVVEGPGSITPAGAQPVTHTNVESVSIASAIRLSQSVFSAVEDAGPAAIDLSRIAGNGSASVDFDASDGTADSSDYTPTSTSVSFDGPETTQAVQIPLTADADPEPDETVILDLGNPSAGTHLCEPDAGVLTIEDDDGADLRVTMTDSPDPVKVGAKLTHKVTVRNIGNVADTNVVMGYQLPDGALFVGANSNPAGDSCSRSGALVTCTHGTLAAGSTVTFTINVIPTATGSAAASASAAGGVPDVDPSNDADETTTVVQMPACTINGTAGPDTLTGTPGNDVICGKAGVDDIDGRGGNDVLIGAGRSDTLLGAGGFDVLLGGKGRDVLDSRDGVSANDAVNGGPLSDTCRTDPGDLRTSCP
jgi:hypothetical protein